MQKEQTKTIRIVGIATMTNAQTAQKDIEGLWQKAALADVLRTDAPNYGVYCEYQNGKQESYRVIVGSESDAAPTANQVVIEIPRGTYLLVQSDEGSVADVVPKAWRYAWEHWEEKRSYHIDYERYIGDPQHAKFELHIGINP